MLDAPPEARERIGDRGYDSDGFRAALLDKGIAPCVPPTKVRKVQHSYCK